MYCFSEVTSTYKYHHGSVLLYAICTICTLLYYLLVTIVLLDQARLNLSTCHVYRIISETLVDFVSTCTVKQKAIILTTTLDQTSNDTVYNIVSILAYILSAYHVYHWSEATAKQ